MSNRVERLAADLNTVAIHLTRRLRRADQNLETTPARLSALSVLVFDGPKRVSELAAIEQVTSATMSRIAAALVKEGFVERRPSSDDRRVVFLDATQAGIELMQRGRRQRVERLAKELRGLSEAQRSTLEEAVRVLKGLEDDADG